MKQIKVTAAFAIELQTKPWVIVCGDEIVAAYNSRDEARTDKKAKMITGSIVKTAELEIDIVMPAQAPAEQPAESEHKPYGYEIHGLIHCPHCGIHLDNGIGEHMQEVNGKPIKHNKYEFECLACGNEFGPEIKAAAKKTPGRKTEITNVSTIERPCKKVWDIAENMIGAKRKDVLAACVEAGIAYYTARTQYQQWLGIRKEMAAEAAVREAKAAK